MLSPHRPWGDVGSIMVDYCGRWIRRACDVVLWRPSSCAEVSGAWLVVLGFGTPGKQGTSVDCGVCGAVNEVKDTFLACES
jgi:hypothetical protein